MYQKLMHNKSLRLIGGLLGGLLLSVPSTCSSCLRASTAAGPTACAR